MEWDKRRLKRVRQHDSRRKIDGLQGSPDGMAPDQSQFAVSELSIDALIDFGHPRQQRPGPVWRHNRDVALGPRPPEAHEQCLSHDHIPNPGGSNNQDALGGCHRISVGRQWLPDVNMARIISFRCR